MKPRHQIKFGKQRTSLGPKVKTIPKATLTQRPTDSDGGDNDVVHNAVTIGERQLHFARALSDTEKHVREASLRSLREWLVSHGAGMTADELQRLWKALFYCLWMADKRSVITAVVRDIVDLYDIIGWPYLEALFSCMMREWFGIDRHRIDKFYELISTALTKALSSFLNNDTFPEFSDGLDRFLELLTDRIWQPSRKQGVGLALHVLDVYLDRVVSPVLQKAASKHQCDSKQLVELFNRLSDDVFTMAGARNGWLPSLNRRIHERILGRLVEVVTDSKLNLTPAAQVHVIDRAATEAFSVASDGHTELDARKNLYEMHLELKGFVHETKLGMTDEEKEALENEIKNDSHESKDKDKDHEDKNEDNNDGDEHDSNDNGVKDDKDKDDDDDADDSYDDDDNNNKSTEAQEKTITDRITVEEEDGQRSNGVKKSKDATHKNTDQEVEKPKDGTKRTKRSKSKRRKSDNHRKGTNKPQTDDRKTSDNNGKPKGSKRSAVIEPAGEARVPKKWKRQKKQGIIPV